MKNPLHTIKLSGEQANYILGFKILVNDADCEIIEKTFNNFILDKHYKLNNEQIKRLFELWGR